MEKTLINNIINEYKVAYPGEKSRIKNLITYLNDNNDEEMCDWDNMKGHLTASAFIYSKRTKRFLVLYHNDLKYFYCSGGHCEIEHLHPLDTVYHEIEEETGIKNKTLIGMNNEIVPIDIDIHNIPYNVRVNIPAHIHYDFRYLFVVDDEVNVKLDESELSDYKWVDINELSLYSNYGRIIKKLKGLLDIE